MSDSIFKICLTYILVYFVTVFFLFLILEINFMLCLKYASLYLVISKVTYNGLNIVERIKKGNY